MSPRIGEAVSSVRSGYERLILIVGAPGSGKSSSMFDAAGSGHWPVINLSLTLAEMMLEVPAPQRPARALDCVRGLVEGLDSDVVCLDNIELLFEPSLQVDPLALLQSLSRELTLVVAWPGRVTGGNATRLLHAERSHPEYRDYPAQGLVLLSVPAE